MERENLAGGAKGKGANGSNREAKGTDALVALPGTPASFHRSPIRRLAERRLHNRRPQRLARRRG